MKTMTLFLALIVLCHFPVLGQGTAFTYQGRLNNNGSPANGSYDLQFTLFATNVTGAAFAGPVTNEAVAVTNGLFTISVDFGNAFTGASNWLELAVSTNGANAFTILAPRQQLTPVPCALFANTASNLAGNLSTTQLSGTIPATNVTGSFPLAQLPGGVVTNNLAWTPNGTLTSQYQITMAETNWVNLVETFWTNSAGCLVYTNKATNGLTIFLVYNDLNWVANYQTPVWTIQTNFPDNALTAIYISSGNPATPPDSPLGVGVYQFNNFLGNSALQVLALNSSINSLAIQAPNVSAGNIQSSNLITSQSLLLPDLANPGDGIWMGDAGNGSTLGFYGKPVPTVPNGIANVMNVFMSPSAASTDHTIGWQSKMYTNFAGATHGFFQEVVDTDRQAGPIGTSYFFSVPLNAYGQSLFGQSDIVGNPDVNPYLFPPAVVDIWNNVPGRTNSAGLWIQPAPKSPNPQAGILETDGTNFYIGVTNSSNGQSVVLPLFAGSNGSGLTNLNASSLPGITTNVSAAGITFYITNGLIMRVSTP